MPLNTGDRLGPYEVIRAIGSGGMGDVYEAVDTRLGRHIAIKVIRGPFSERFEREARAISALNHTHVCALYDVGHDGGLNYLVMELIDGKPLRGPLPAAEAVKYALQIADALDAAHRKDIVHRDLKPANILVTKTGVKLLDFGLAKAAVAAAGSESTITHAITGEGQIVGTLQYMAPEQLEGKEATTRSDIFSFGCVLYEALSGAPPFTGASSASLIAAIMTSAPKPLSECHPMTPPAIGRVVQTCLAKDPDARFQSAHDLKLALEWATGDQPFTPSARRSAVPWLIGLCLAAVAGAFATATLSPGRSKSGVSSPSTVRFRFSEPEGVYAQRFIATESLSISPTGGHIAIVANDAQGRRIWVRDLQAVAMTPLPGTEGARVLFWSPDGKHIGFWAEGQMKRIAIDSGTAVPICPFAEPMSGTWSYRGHIVATVGLYHSYDINVDTGAITEVDLMLWPQFLPDGKRLLYVRADPSIRSYRAYLRDVDSGFVTPLMATDTLARYVRYPGSESAGTILFGRGSTLLAQRLDADRPDPNGATVAVAERVPFFRPTAWSDFTASEDGHVVVGLAFFKSQFAWVNREGRELEKVGDEREHWGSARLDRRSGRAVADVFDIAKGTTDLWMLNMRTNVVDRLTFDPGAEVAGVWSPDGTQIVFGGSASGVLNLRMLSVGQPESIPISPSKEFQMPTDWSADGRWIAFQTSGTETVSEIWFASAREDRKIYPILKQEGSGYQRGRFSPDGKYLAFASTESGRSEVYVQAIEPAVPPHVVGERRRVSVNGGRAPRWRLDGRELFFVGLTGQLFSVEVNGLAVSAPTHLFDMPPSMIGMNASTDAYEIDPKGQRFLIVQRKATGGARFEVIANWPGLNK